MVTQDNIKLKKIYYLLSFKLWFPHSVEEFLGKFLNFSTKINFDF